MLAQLNWAAFVGGENGWAWQVGRSLVGAKFFVLSVVSQCGIPAGRVPFCCFVVGVPNGRNSEC